MVVSERAGAKEKVRERMRKEREAEKKRDRE